MKQFKFEIEISSTGLGVVTAENKEEALVKIENEDWDDIIDVYRDSYGSVTEIDDGEEVENNEDGFDEFVKSRDYM